MIVNQTCKKHNEHVVAGFFFLFWGKCSFLSGGNIFEQVLLVRIQRPAVCLASRQNQHMVRLNSFDHNQTRGFVFHMLVSSFCSNAHVLTNLCYRRKQNLAKEKLTWVRHLYRFFHVCFILSGCHPRR